MSNVQLNISGENWFKDPDLLAVMSALNKDGDNARVVGGAVRDTLLNIFWKRKRKIGDVDLASKLVPEENMSRLKHAGINVIPTGIKHGTVTAILNNKPFEITTLRRDVTTDGRHAEVEFTEDWVEDAKRRDFTINALYLDQHGDVYDPLDGFDDIKRAKVCFIGDAKKRIEEDALRILRFFRFSSDIEVGGVDEQGMLACVELKNMIRGLSGERIREEFKKILASKRARQVIPVLATIGILREILPDYDEYGEFLKYVKRENKLSRKNLMGRLSCLLPLDEKIIIKTSSHLKLSNKDRDVLLAYAREYHSHDLTAITLRRVIYRYGKEVVIHHLIKQDKLDPKTLNYIKEYHVPELPVTGKDLLKEGWKTGREMGAELKRREQAWIEADFNFSETEALH